VITRLLHTVAISNQEIQSKKKKYKFTTTHVPALAFHATNFSTFGKGGHRLFAQKPPHSSQIPLRSPPKKTPPLHGQAPTCRRRRRRRGSFLRPQHSRPIRYRRRLIRREGSQDAGGPAGYAQEIRCRRRRGQLRAGRGAGFGGGVRARGGREGASRGGGVRLHEAVVPGRTQGGARRRHHHAGARRPDVPQRIRCQQERAQGETLRLSGIGCLSQVWFWVIWSSEYDN